MAIDLTDDRYPDDDGPAIARRRGGFYRNRAGVPQITKPDGSLVKSGPRKGLPSRTPYSSFSGMGDEVENKTNIEKWDQRNIVLGVGIRPEPLVDDCVRLVELERDSKEFKTAADSIVARARTAAKADRAAEQGTHHHLTTELDVEGFDWMTAAAAGELVDIPTDAQARIVAGWRAMLDREGLEVLASEAACVNDHCRGAGTLDHLVRTTKPLRFVMFGGHVVTVPADIVAVLDKKAGQMRRDERTRAIKYWQSYAPQVTGYAGSQPYDTELETRGEWPWDISQEHALIAHLDGAGAIRGDVPVDDLVELVYVDLVEGRELLDLCIVAKRFDAMNTSKSTTFSIARPADDAAPSPELDALAPVDAGDDTPTAPEATAAASPVAEEAAAVRTVDDVVAELGEAVAERTPIEPPSYFETAEARKERLYAWLDKLNLDQRTAFNTRGPFGGDLDLVEAALEDVDPFARPAEGPPRPAKPAKHTDKQPPAPPPAIEPEPLLEPELEGVDVDPDTWTAAGRRFAELDDDGRQWLQRLTGEAAAAGLYFSGHGGRRTTRRYWLAVGLVTLAASGNLDDDLVRTLVATVLDPKADGCILDASERGITAGAAVGVLNHTEAQHFARGADMFVADALAVVTNDAGLMRLKAA